MKDITQETFQEWLNLYLDNKLSGKDLHDFESFILNHPDLSKNEDIKSIKTKGESAFFDTQTLLKARMIRQVIEEEEQTAFLAAENALDEDKKIRLAKRKQVSPRLKEKIEAYSEARLQPDLSIVFPSHKLLYPKKKTVIPGWWPYAAAACVAALLMVFSLNHLSFEDREVPVAQKPKPTILQQQKKEQVTSIPDSSRNSSVETTKNPTVNRGSRPTKLAEPIKPSAKQEAGLASRKPASPETGRRQYPVTKSPAKSTTPKQPERIQYNLNVPVLTEPTMANNEEVKKVSGPPTAKYFGSPAVQAPESVLFKGGQKLIKALSRNQWELSKYINNEGETVVGLYTPVFDLIREKK